MAAADKIINGIAEKNTVSGLIIFLLTRQTVHHKQGRYLTD